MRGHDRWPFGVLGTGQPAESASGALHPGECRRRLHLRRQRCWSGEVLGGDEWGQAYNRWRVTQVSTHTSHTCWIDSDAEIFCRGSYDWGTGEGPIGKYSHVDVGTGFTCAITDQGAIECWGDSSNGQTKAPSGRFTQISAGHNHVCAVTHSTGRVRCWGNDEEKKASPPNSRFAEVSAGSWASCGVTDEGELKCWGINFRSVESDFDPSAFTFTNVSVGEFHSCAITSEDKVMCWGDNTFGQADPPSGSFTQVSAGFSHSCGITTEGAIKCWGGDPLYGSSFAAERDAALAALQPLGFRIAARALDDGRVEFGIQADVGQLILPERPLPRRRC